MTASVPLPLDIRLMAWAANVLFALIAIIGLMAMGAWVARQPVWALGGVTVVGDVAHQDAVTIRAHLATRLEGTFLTVNLLEVQRLLEGVPWVRHAVVQREFPNRLRVQLEEHEAVAWWGEPGGDRLLNRHGEVFEAHPEDPLAESWSQLTGPDDRSGQVYELYERLKPVFARMGEEVRRLELDVRGSWRVRLASGAQIELGRGDAAILVQRVEQFALTVPTLTLRYGQRDIESADLRYPNGYALRMRGVSTLLEPPPVPPTVPAAPSLPTPNAR